MPKYTPKVFLTRRLPEAVIDRLEEHVELEMNPEDRVLTREELIAGVSGKDALLCLLTDQIDEKIMDASPQLKVIANYAVGFNNIDLEAAKKRKIVVTNTPDILTDTSADFSFAMILAIGRRIVEADNYFRTGKWDGWGPLQFLGTDIHGATLGIIGMGRIGKAVVKRARAFDMEVIYWNRTRFSVREEKALGLKYMKLNDVINKADFISIHVAYNEETHHLIGEPELQKMKQSAYIINTSRGAVIDEKALVVALQENKIAGAALDVFENEPTAEPELLTMKNVILFPHIASATTATRLKMGMKAVDNLLAVLNGKKAENRVV